MKLSRLLLFAAACCAVVIALGAALDLSGVFRFGHHLSTTTYATRSELIKEWDKSAPWLPNDATGIQIKEVKEYGPTFDPAILRSTSHSSLNPALCVQASRLSSPAFTAPWSPGTNVPKVFVCGDWDVIPTEDGWFGWTKNSQRERAAAAQDGQQANERRAIRPGKTDGPYTGIRLPISRRSVT
jgi:hypothetical protein